jgi:hypothetical protein
MKIIRPLGSDGQSGSLFGLFYFSNHATHVRLSAMPPRGHQRKKFTTLAQTALQLTARHWRNRTSALAADWNDFAANTLTRNNIASTVYAESNTLRISTPATLQPKRIIY